MNKTIMLIALGLLAGCAKHYSWAVEPGQMQQYYRDDSYCQSLAAQGGGPVYNLGSAIRHNSQRDSIYGECMKGRGYVEVQK